jgi:anti-repressor protein
LDLGFDKSNWAKWSRINVAENMFFKNGVDWVGFVLSTNGNETNDYAVSLNMAQHLAMMEKTQRAHDYRNYFIECEKKANDKTAHIEPPKQSKLIEVKHPKPLLIIPPRHLSR